MTGCHTCGGGLGKHDPVAHGYPDTEGESVPGSPNDDEPCMCGTGFTCVAEVHDQWVYDAQLRASEVLE